MGVLWIARHRALRSEVVVKFLNDELADTPSAAGRIAREAALAARVRSPHVVQVLDHGVSDGKPFLVMELLEGCDLRAHLAARGLVSPEETIVMMRQLAKALVKAHSAGIVHQDIKPSNIFLCDVAGEVFVKLLDFGLARRCKSTEQSSTASQHCAGTPAYMSPEQILGGDVDPSSDVWSLGVLAFQCLTGKRPFEGETLGAVALVIHTLPVPRLTEFNPKLPATIDAWFARACSRPRARRFASAVEAVDSMANALRAHVPRLAESYVEAAVETEPPESDDLAANHPSRQLPARRRRGTGIASPAIAAATILLAAGVYHAISQTGRASALHNAEPGPTPLPTSAEKPTPHLPDDPPHSTVAAHVETAFVAPPIPPRPPSKVTARGAPTNTLRASPPAVSLPEVAVNPAGAPRPELPDERH